MSYLETLFALQGRVAVVTGGSSGIGRAMAEALGRAGARVILVARRVAELEAAAAAIAGARTVSADLGDRAALARACDEIAVIAEPDILVNAAGVNLRPPMDQLAVEDWDASLEVNLTAPFLLGQRFAPAMAARGFGRIINVGSQQSIRAFGNSGAYGVAKAGVLALTRSQAEAWSRHGVCCNAIAPGFVRTPLAAPALAIPGRAEALAARTMIGRNGEPADFAGIAVFLASRASDYVTGQTIFVDGGFSAC